MLCVLYGFQVSGLQLFLSVYSTVLYTIWTLNVSVFIIRFTEMGQILLHFETKYEFMLPDIFTVCLMNSAYYIYSIIFKVFKGKLMSKTFVKEH